MAADVGEIDIEKADGINLELAVESGPMSFKIRQPAKATALKAATQCRTRELRVGRLQWVEKVFQGQRLVFAKSHDDGLFLNAECCRSSLPEPHGCIVREG